MGLIYRTTNLINGKMYIGKQVNEKRKDYLGSGVAFTHALKKYGRKCFSREVLISGIENQRELSDIEIYYIGYYCAQQSKMYYNISGGGDTPRNIPRSQWSEERKKKFSEDCKIRYNTPEAKERFSRQHLGFRHSEESKRKMSVKKADKNSPLNKEINQYDLDGNFLQTFYSAKEALRVVGGKSSGLISDVCNGKKHTYTAYGYRWKYKEPTSKS